MRRTVCLNTIVALMLAVSHVLLADEGCSSRKGSSVWDTPGVVWETPGHLYRNAIEKAKKDRQHRIQLNLKRLKAAAQPGAEDPWSFAQAAAELGLMRAAEAIPALTRRAMYRPKGFEPEMDSAGSAHPLSFYPAAAALTQIGPIIRHWIIPRIVHADGEDREYKIRFYTWILIHSQDTDLEYGLLGYNRCENLADDKYKYVALAWFRPWLERAKTSSDPDLAQWVPNLQMAMDIVRGFQWFGGRPYSDLFFFPPIYELPHARVGRSYRFVFNIRLPRIKPYTSSGEWEPRVQLLEDPEQFDYDFGFPSLLPQGLELTEDGILRGTPRQSGRFRFVARVGQKTNTRYLDNYTEQEFLLVVDGNGACEKRGK